MAGNTLNQVFWPTYHGCFTITSATWISLHPTYNYWGSSYKVVGVGGQEAGSIMFTKHN